VATSFPNKQEKLQPSETSDVSSKDIGSVVVAMKNLAESRRNYFERRWYDNNFFDDGYHFRYVHRTTGKIVDLANKSDIWSPKRAIPKASRQLRGMANQLAALNFHPVVYPARVDKSKFRPDIYDQQSGQVIQDPNYAEALSKAKLEAKQVGIYLEDEWAKHEFIDVLLPYMIILSMKNSVSWLQVWNDVRDNTNRVQVYDAFDVYGLGHLSDAEKSPFLVKAVPKLLSDILSNQYFDEAQREKVLPDNKYAASQIKESYMNSRYGGLGSADNVRSSICYEAYIKEVLDEDNARVIKKQDDADLILEGKNYGDTVVRQVYSTESGVWLSDNYTGLPKYPLVPLTLEPGPLYQVPLIERFIDANKSLDNIVSRIERYAHTMGVGIWTKREGENFKISNAAGGQVITYKNRPPEQKQIAPLPNFMFSIIDFMESIIEEQGVSTTSLSKIPSGVRSNAAIESLKASEFSNLDIHVKQVRSFIRRITERLIYYSGNYVSDPQEVEDGDGGYFDVMGVEGVRIREEIDIAVPQAIIIDPAKLKFKIETESGPGYTMQGRRENMMELARFMAEQAAAGFLNPESVKKVVQRLLETYQFGSVSEFMEILDEGPVQEGVSEEDIDKIKIAILEVMKDIKSQQGGGQGVQEQVQ
jgi:hypothetical protein